jgi:hypothetical protein
VQLRIAVNTLPGEATNDLPLTLELALGGEQGEYGMLSSIDPQDERVEACLAEVQRRIGLERTP